MVEISSNLKKAIIDVKNNTDQKRRDTDVILFFSFDIVNSSLYKTINYSSWTVVINEIFKYIDDLAVKEIEKCELWRILGDEILYIVRITDKEQIYKYVDSIFKILLETNKYLSSGKIFEKITSNVNLEILKMQNVLSIKGASWIAIVAKDNINAEDVGIENAYINYRDFKSLKNMGFIEFLGNDIDTGFRISKETRSRRLVLGFELAYILKLKTEYLSKLNLVTFKRLKGVWHDKLYPIIWFHDRHEFDNLSLEESFEFDELEEDELSREYFDNRKNQNNKYIDKKMYEDINYALDKVLESRKLNFKIKKIISIIEESKEIDKEYTNKSLLEMHCVAVCFKIEEKEIEILIAKRSQNRNCLKGKWEFGCAKANYNEHIIDTIKREYKQDFGIDINIICQENRTDTQPMPIAIYEVNKNKTEYHKGVIFIAKCSNYHIKKNDDKHEEIRWISKNDINDFKDEECVEDFKSTLQSAFEQIERYLDKEGKI